MSNPCGKVRDNCRSIGWTSGSSKRERHSGKGDRHDDQVSPCRDRQIEVGTYDSDSRGTRECNRDRLSGALQIGLNFDRISEHCETFNVRVAHGVKRLTPGKNSEDGMRPDGTNVLLGELEKPGQLSTNLREGLRFECLSRAGAVQLRRGARSPLRRRCPQGRALSGRRRLTGRLPVPSVNIRLVRRRRR